MKFGKLEEHVYLVRFERGEELLDSLLTFCRSHDIKNSTLSALGALQDPTIAHYDIQTKQYNEKTLEGMFELTNLTGNIAIYENDIVAHCHITLSDQSMHAYGGHFVRGAVAGTVEMTITVCSTNFEKKMDEEIGLKLFDLPEKI